MEMRVLRYGMTELRFSDHRPVTATYMAEVEVSPVLPPGDQESSQVSGGSQLSLKDAFLSKAKVKTISEINGISEVDLLSVFIVYSLQLEVEFA